MHERPDPDALLRRLRAEEAHGSRGRLKIFFGAAPGVGKTYAMLEAARKAAAEGVDAAIGWLETHGRVETAALAEGFERIRPREAVHRGVTLHDFDLDAALARRPRLLLLDELAHTNAPGGRHTKRWQDAQELLDAGIDVYSTLNVQHLESLNDLVARITGVAVRETLPDTVLETAEEVEFIDLPPEELLKRLGEGRVYASDQAARATESFFRKGNLIALRELALRRTADRVDAQMQDYRRDHEIAPTWPVAERMLLCVRPHPESPGLIRAARRMASTLRAEWIVVSVESPSQSLSSTDRESIVGALKLAEELGAETAVLSGESVAETLLTYARERNVSRIVVGKPAHGRWRDRLRGSLLDEIVRGSGDIDVTFIAAPGARARERLGRMGRRRVERAAYLQAAAVVALATLVCAALFRQFDKSNLVMIYLLGVSWVAVRHGRGPAALASCLSVALFDFFFVPPHLTFSVTDSQYVVTFAVMLVVGLLISTLAVRVKDQAEAARQRERRSQVLYALSRELGSAHLAEEVATVSCHHVDAFFGGGSALLLPLGSAAALRVLPPGAPVRLREPQETAVAQWVLEHGRPAGIETDTLPGAAALYVPLRSGERVLGVLAVQPAESRRPLGTDETGLLGTVARLVSAALDRVLLAQQSERAQMAVERERLRNTLLSSVSHDFRTPLAAITGAVTCLIEDASLGEASRRDLEQTIREEAERLNRLVTNLLDMTRLESGTIALRRDWHSLEEIVGSALARVERRLAPRRVHAELPLDFPLVRVDAGLLEQVFVNLFENAIKYTGPEATLRIEARRNGAQAEVTVADDGPGIPAGAEERIFEKFQRLPSGSQPGFGLGLPICRAVVAAHGGAIWAEALRPRGVAFRFTLPLEAEPAAPPSSPTD